MASAEPKTRRHRRRFRQKWFVARKTKWTLVLLSVAIIAVSMLIVAVMLGWISMPELPERPVATQPSTPVEEDTVIHFIAGGDVNVTQKVVNAGGYDYDYGDVFLDVLPVLSGGDLTVLNFEGNVCGEPYGTELRSAPTQLLQALRNTGVDVLQTANSYAITNGLRGLVSTATAIREAGMQPLGTYADEAEFKRYQGYLMYEVEGISIALVAFTKGMDGRNLPEGSENCVNLLYEDYSSTYKKINEDGIIKVLRNVQQAQPDITIALVHWGSEHNDQLSTTQEQICSLMNRYGVSAIIGTHPHYVQKMGFDQQTGQFVAYSLGDFLGDAEIAGTNYSVLLDLELTRDGATGQVSITNYSYTPLFQYYEEDGTLRVLRIREAIAAYEQNYIGKVPEEVYRAMVSALSRIEARVEGS